MFNIGALAQTPAVAFVVRVAPTPHRFEVSNVELQLLIPLLIGLLLIALTVGLSVRRRALKQDERKKLDRDSLLPPSQREAAEEAGAPVRDTEELSLRELKRTRSSKLSEEFKDSEAARKAREWRKGAQQERLDDVVSEPEGTPPVPATEKDEGSAEAESRSAAEVPSTEKVEPSEPEEAQPQALEDGLAKTRKGGFIGRLKGVFSQRRVLDDDAIEAIEEVLFTADIGASTSQHLLQLVEERLSEGETAPDEIWDLLKAECSAILESSARTFEVATDAPPFVVLVVGVNGVGKTTTIGKLAARYQQEGHKVMMIAGDTFRAAAVQQLQEWSSRVGCGFHRGADEADPSGVIYEGIERARKEGYTLVLADTAGRLHTRTPLVDELKKIVRVAGKAHEGAPHETVLVLDANTGQNAIQQARQFGDAVDLSGLVLTKLDGTAKGGVILGVSRELRLPVYFIGIGEGVRDLRPFDAQEFVDALF